MPESEAHRTTAENLARKYHTEYNRGEGPDIQTDDITIEVETYDTVEDAEEQLDGFTGPVYVAGTDERTVQKALRVYRDSDIGVMDAEGDIWKTSTRM